MLAVAIVMVALGSTKIVLSLAPLGAVAFIWPGAGIAIAALQIWRMRALPGVFIAVFAFELIRGDGLVIAFAGAALSTLAVWLVHYLMVQVMRFEGTFQSLRDGLALLAGAGFMVLLKLASVVAALYAMGGHLSLETAASTWASPIAAGLGVLVVTPFILAWYAEWRETFNVRRALELSVLTTAVVTMSILAFCGPMFETGEIAHLPYTLFPLAFWAALRFSAREVGTVILITSVCAVWYTARGLGPYATSDLYQGQVALGMFLTVLAGTSWLLVVAVRQLARVSLAAESRGARLGALIDRINEGVASFDANERFTFVSARFREITGYSNDDLIGRRALVDLIHPEDRGRLRPAAATAERNATDATDAQELRMLKRSGEQMTVQLSHRYVDTDSTCGGMGLALINDITAAKLAQDALRDSEAKYRVLVDNQTELVVRLARNDTVAFVSPSYKRFFGKTDTELVGKKHELDLHDDDRAGWDDLIRTAWDRCAASHTEFLVNTPSGQRWLAWSAQCLTDCSDGMGDSLILVARDATDRHRAEEQSRAHLQQLAHVSRVASMGEMAAAIAHEINQPLAAIANYCSASVRLLRAGQSGTEDALNAMQKVASEAERAGEIVRRMRSFVRSEEGELAAVAPRELVAHVVGLTNADARQSGVAVIVDVPADLPEVLVDGIQIEQVLFNLVRNAIEAIDSTPTRDRFVRIRAQRVIGKGSHASKAAGDDAVEFVVGDTGPGLRADQCERVFDAFYTTKKDGMGIGLALSRSIAEAHGGSLTASSRRGEGASFHLRLPAVVDQETINV